LSRFYFLASKHRKSCTIIKANRRYLLAISSSHAETIAVFQESFFAETTNDAIASANWTRVWIGARGRASGSARQEDFILIAFRDRWEHLERFRLRNRVTFACFDASTGLVTEKSLFAGATWFADTWAQWIGVLARSIATFAFTEFFVVTALLDWWKHHERFWLRNRFSVAFARVDASASFATEMTFFASTAGDADTWAQWIRILARSIATFALTEFLVVTADLRRDRHGFGSWHAAVFRLDADALFVFQETRFAEATDDALFSADWRRIGIGAGWSARRTAP